MQKIKPGGINLRDERLKEMLVQGAAELGVPLDEAMADKLLVYKDFLKEYSKKVNLTSITEDKGIIIKHFFDSMTVLPEMEISSGTKIVDIGTGAGFPGIVLKILHPGAELALVDSTRKKIRFLEELAAKLGLEGVVCIHARAEDLPRQETSFAEGFDYAVSRAVAPLPKLAGYCLPFVRAGGEFIAMKGRNYEEELAYAQKAIEHYGGRVIGVREAALPESDIAHSIIRIKKINSKNFSRL